MTKLIPPQSICWLLLVVFLTASSHTAYSHPAPPEVRREFRAAWIATVANIDWPSSKGLSTEEQKQELRLLLDKAVELNLNAIIFQVRPACDALYRSPHEPWSEYLMGEMGKPPEPAYDPLTFAVEEAHKRGLQLHAWFNPYRARHKTAQGEAAPLHVSKNSPELIVEYGPQQWLDPGNLQALEHTIKVVCDVVTRYDVDGVHFDDYFYPYPVTEETKDKDEAKVEIPFPDDSSWNDYQNRQAGSSLLSREDWRRDNVNQLVRRIGEEVKAIKPHVLFGVSPFGIWRPGHPESVVGFDPYEKIYADSKLWLHEGWIDYFTPQLYWPIRSEGQSYPILLSWWTNENVHGRHLWPGQYTSRVGEGPGRGWKANEIVEQITLTRSILGAGGTIHFSMKALSQNYGGVAEALKVGPYATPALVPATPWLTVDKSPPSRPEVRVDSSEGMARIKWWSKDDETPFVWVVQSLDENWTTRVLPSGKNEFDYSSSSRPSKVAITAVDRLGRVSPTKVTTLDANETE